MKKNIFLGVLFFSSLGSACPDLSGTYQCPAGTQIAEKETLINISQQKAGDITEYKFTFPSEPKRNDVLKADNTDVVTLDKNGSKNLLRVSCQKNTLNIHMAKLVTNSLTSTSQPLATFDIKLSIDAKFNLEENSQSRLFNEKGSRTFSTKSKKVCLRVYDISIKE